MSRDLTIAISRYYPGINKPYLQEYTINTEECKGVMLLDALEVIKAKDPTLSFRRSCGGGVCGSDGMNIDGKNGLACMTPLASLKDKITIRPLPGLPIIRDLVVDMTKFYKQFNSVDPYLKGKELSKGSREYIQTKEERENLDGLYECILCACCTTACPSWWWNPDKFVGPAGLLWAARFIMDTRDANEEERLKDLEGLYRLYRCRGIMNCTTVCPKELNPAEAIAKVRSKVNKQKSGNSN